MFHKKTFLVGLMLFSQPNGRALAGEPSREDSFKPEEGTAFSPVSVSSLSTPDISTEDLAYLQDFRKRLKDSI